MGDTIVKKNKSYILEPRRDDIIKTYLFYPNRLHMKQKTPLTKDFRLPTADL